MDPTHEPTVEGFETYLRNRPGQLSNPDFEQSCWTVAYLRNLFGEVNSIKAQSQAAIVNRREDPLDKETAIQLPMAICNFFEEELLIDDAISSEDALRRLQSIDRKIMQSQKG